jgi:hypothetical protein
MGLSTVLVEAVKEYGGWVTRTQIAQKVRKGKNLTAYDIAVLDDLVRAGVLECQERVRGVAQRFYEYRVREE